MCIPMVTDAWEPIDFLAEFRERETCLREVTELLKEKAQSETGKLWAHHLPRIVDALDFFQGLLQDAIDHFGEWRYHEFQPAEVLDFIDEDLDGLSQWLSRMTNTPLPTQMTNLVPLRTCLCEPIPEIAADLKK